MTSDKQPTLKDVFSYVEEVYRNCRLMIKDAAHELRNSTGCYFEHVYKWDYMTRPNEHFLNDACCSASRCWAAYLPKGDLGRGAMFFIQFHAAKRVVEPALMFGSFVLGEHSVDTAYRWAPYNAVVHAEENDAEVRVERGNIFTTVYSQGTEHFAETVLVRVPLEDITDTDTLRRIVVQPLAAMVQGDNKKAKERLAGTRTIAWPIGVVEPDENEDPDEEEQA